MTKRLLHSPFTSIVLASTIVFLGLFISRITPTYINNFNKIANATKQIEDVQKTRHELAQKSAYLKSDAYLERQARLKLNYKKPGETVVFVYDNPYNKSSKSQESLLPKLKQDNSGISNWHTWFNFLFGR